AAACAAGEIALRLVRPQPLEAAYMWPDGTLRHIPSFSYTYARGEFASVARFNALGLRGPEIPARKDPARLRTIFLGDSFVEGAQVEEDLLLTTRLQRLSGSPPRLEVINAGVAGTGTSEELILFDRALARLQPDLVLLGWYPNDVRNNADRRLFRIVEGQAVAAREPSLPKARFVYDLRKFFASRSHLYMLVKLAVDAATEEDPVERRAGKAAAPALNAAAPLEAEEVFERKPSDLVAGGWNLSLALLSAMKHHVEAGGARFVLVVFPSRFQVDDALWRDQTARIAVDPGAFDLAKPQRVLSEWAHATGTPVIDLLDEFRRRNVSNTFYFKTDAHWNPLGHELAAETIAKGLREIGILDQAAPPPAR
ncbi:MAG TPA: SGNH/GDSL hydrolase family protein, partial [Verrucomicrobiae bacterium]|nr:SGNH/GDSL hydrolase family protein [Verrucomicrobiae bacterium]